MRTRISAALTGALLAGLLSTATPAADAGALAAPRSCRAKVCLTLGLDGRGPGVRIASVDVRKPRKGKVKARAWWSYRQPHGRTHKSRDVPATNHRGVAVAYWSTDVQVAHGTKVCGKLGRTKTCMQV